MNAKKELKNVKEIIKELNNEHDSIVSRTKSSREELLKVNNELKEKSVESEKSANGHEKQRLVVQEVNNSKMELSKIKDENNHGETVLSQMLTEMEDSGTSNIVVVGITNRPDLIDNSMLRNGRLDVVLFVQQPDEKSRLDIIKILTDGMPLANNINLNEIAVSTQNYTGADLASLCREAAVNAMQRDSLNISSNDFALGLKRVRPSITKDIDKWYSDIKSEVSNIIPKSSGDA